MAPKKKLAKNQEAEQVVERQGPVQAVVLACSFAEQSFLPLTLEHPQPLLPLVNTPMLHYTLQWLAFSGVDEALVLCSPQVQAYLEQSGWLSEQPAFPSHFRVAALILPRSAGCTPGSALRFLYDCDILLGDFVLVSAGLVSNLSSLAPLLAQHRESKRSGAVLTMVLKTSSSALTDSQFTIDPHTKELLHYHDPNDDDEDDNMSSSEHPRFEDCHIDICSLEVLHLLQENFDYHHLRNDFVKGLLSHQDIGTKIYIYYMPPDLYASCVNDMGSYALISKDIIRTWSYPMLPTPGNRRKCDNERKSHGVSVLEYLDTGSPMVLGKGTLVGSNSSIYNSVIGCNCTIGNNVVIEGSFIWDNVTICDNVQIRHAIICTGCIVGEGAVVEQNSVLSFNVMVKESRRIPPNVRLSLMPEPSTNDNEIDIEKIHEGCVDVEMFEATNKLHPTTYSWKFVNEAEMDWKNSIAPIPADRMVKKRERYKKVQEPDDEVESFDEEIEEIFRRLAVDGIPENMFNIELNDVKLAHNSSLAVADCARALLKSIVNLALEQPHRTEKELFELVKRLVVTWKYILVRNSKPVDIQVELVLKLEDICLSSSSTILSSIFCSILVMLYEEDVICEDAIISWSSKRQNGDEGEKVFYKQCTTFIKWLQEASEEDDDDL